MPNDLSMSLKNLKNLVEKKSSIEEMLYRLENERMDFSPVVIQNVRQDFRNKLKDIDTKILALNPGAREIILLRNTKRDKLRKTELDLEEVVLRHTLGQIPEDEMNRIKRKINDQKAQILLDIEKLDSAVISFDMDEANQEDEKAEAVESESHDTPEPKENETDEEADLEKDEFPDFDIDSAIEQTMDDLNTEQESEKEDEFETRAIDAKDILEEVNKKLNQQEKTANPNQPIHDDDEEEKVTTQVNLDEVKREMHKKEEDFQKSEPQKSETEDDGTKTSAEGKRLVTKNQKNGAKVSASKQLQELREKLPEGAPLPVLKIMTGKAAQTIFPLSKNEVGIGRLSVNDIKIDNDSSVSRKHATIRKEDDDFFICDLNSSNGTFLNGMRITKARLMSSDIIRIGLTALMFFSDYSDKENI